MANVKYRVSVDYVIFDFEDRNEALDFAEMAFYSVIDAKRSISINFIRADNGTDGEGDK